MTVHTVMASLMLLQSVSHLAPQDPTVTVPQMSTESAMEEDDLVGVERLLNVEGFVSEVIWWVYEDY